MAETVTVTQMKANFSKLVDRAAAGETITITVRGVPVATLEPLPEQYGQANRRDLPGPTSRKSR
jgi:prevent-host-death family protein